MVTCPLHYLTGWLCPFCGGQRMVVCLLRGEVSDAFALNPVAFILIIVVAILFLLCRYNRWAERNSRPTCASAFLSWCTGGTAFILLLALLLVWGLVRNLLI